MHEILNVLKFTKRKSFSIIHEVQPSETLKLHEFKQKIFVGQDAMYLVTKEYKTGKFVSFVLEFIRSNGNLSS